jgi:hypothetical protein
VNPTAILINGTLEPMTISIPGQAIVSADIVFTKALPIDLQLRLELERIEPYFLRVPCLSIPPWEIGSWYIHKYNKSLMVVVYFFIPTINVFYFQHL